MGSYIVRELIRKDFIPRVLVRRKSASKITTACEVVYGDIKNENVVIDTIKGSDAVIYNIGIIRQYPKKGITFEKTNKSNKIF